VSMEEFLTLFSRRVALAARLLLRSDMRWPAGARRPGAGRIPGCSERFLPVTVTDANGTEVTITDISRIVPLSGDIAEIVWDWAWAAIS